MEKNLIKKIGLVGLLVLVVGCSDMGEPEVFLPQLLVSTNAINFSTISIGTNQNREILIVNAGEGELTGTLILVQDSTTFTLVPSGAFTVAADDTLIAEISFNPSSESAFSASVLLSSNDPSDAEISVALIGNGTAIPVPVLSLSRTQINFGTILSSTEMQQVITLSSTGTDTLLISSIAADLAVFDINQTLPLVLIPGDSVNLTISFQPVVAGTFSGSMTISSNSTTSPDMVNLLGIAEAVVSYAASIQPIWNASCVGCHGASGGLSLTSYANLMANNSNHAPVVTASNGATSYLIKKLKGEAGARMPQGGPFLSAATIANIETWINQGALNN